MLQYNHIKLPQQGRSGSEAPVRPCDKRLLFQPKMTPLQKQQKQLHMIQEMGALAMRSMMTLTVPSQQLKSQPPIGGEVGS